MRKKICKLPYFFRGIGENKGMTFSQKSRGQNTLLYEVWERGIKKRYDVFEIRIAKFEIDEYVSQHETYPNTKSYGDWAWSCKEHSKATEKFDELESKDKYCNKK